MPLARGAHFEVSRSGEYYIIVYYSVFRIVGCDPLVGHEFNLVVQDRHALK